MDLHSRGLAKLGFQSTVMGVNQAGSSPVYAATVSRLPFPATASGRPPMQARSTVDREPEAVEPPLRGQRRHVEARRDLAVRERRPRLAHRCLRHRAAPRRRRSPRARGRGRRPARGPAHGSRSAPSSPLSFAWQIQWPSSWAIVKRWRRVGVSPLIASEALTRISRSAGISMPEHSPRSPSSIRRPRRSSAIDSTGTGISSPPKVAR